MTFANPNILWLSLLVVPMVAHYIWRARQGGAAIRISTTEAVRRAPRTVRYYLRHVPFVLRCVAVVLLVVVVARPQSAEHNTRTDAEGIDIVLAIDVSGSMLARDFKPDRLEAAKDVASSFISSRYGDRIGIVVFAGEAYTQSPLTTDQGSLQTLLSRVRSGIIDDGTAIGNGLATAINRLRESDAKSKVVILLTDGVNNRGQIAPITAAEIARDADIKVYTIGVGRNGEAPYPLFDDKGNVVHLEMMKVEIDEKVLRQIAETTGGNYFRATDKESLVEIYNRIDRMEKSRVEVTEFTVLHEEYLVYVLVALALLLSEIVLNRLVLKRIP